MLKTFILLTHLILSCSAYMLTPPPTMKKMLIIGCGRLGKDVASHFRYKGVHVSATTTNSTKIDELHRYADNVLLMTDKSAVKKAVNEVDNIFISVAPKTSSQVYPNVYIDTIGLLINYLAYITKPVHITFISSASAYGTITNGDQVDESYPRPREYNHRAIELMLAENLLMQFQQKHKDLIKLCIFRPQMLLRDPLNLVQWSSGRLLSKEYGNMYMQISHHDEIINAYVWCIRKNLQGLINVSSPPILRKKFLDTVCSVYNIPGPVWSDDLHDLCTTYLPSTNKTIVCKKLQESGYSFLIPDVIQDFLEYADELYEMYGYIPLNH